MVASSKAIVLRDLVGNNFDSVGGVALENFLPAVKLIDQDANQIIVDFSEPMDTASVEAGLALTDAGMTRIAYTVQWDAAGCQATIVPNPALIPGQHYLLDIAASSAKDANGKGLDSVSGR